VDREAERFRGSQIDHELVPGRLLDGQVGRLLAFEYLGDEVPRTAVDLRFIGRDGHEASGLGLDREGEGHWQPTLQCQVPEELALRFELR
jgi:hypothetical protein